MILRSGRRLSQPPRGHVLEDARNRVGRVLLVGADHAGRPPLDPADHVLRGQRPVVVVHHAPTDIADRPAGGIERHVRQRSAAIADRPDDEPALEELLLAGGNRAAVLHPVSPDADGGDRPSVTPFQRQRGGQEPKLDAVAGAAPWPLGVLAQQLDVAAVVVDLEVGRVHDHVCPAELAQLAELGIGERGVLGSAAPQHDHLFDA